MKAKLLLYLPLILFLALAAVLIVRMLRSAHDDNPDSLASALIGKPVPVLVLQ